MNFNQFRPENLKWGRILVLFLLSNIISLILVVSYLKLKSEVTNPPTALGLFFFLLLFGLTSQIIKLTIIYLFYLLTIKYVLELGSNLYIKIALMIIYGLFTIYITQLLFGDIIEEYRNFSYLEPLKKSNAFFLIFSIVYVIQIDIWYLFRHNKNKSFTSLVGHNTGNCRSIVVNQSTKIKRE